MGEPLISREKLIEKAERLVTAIGVSPDSVLEAIKRKVVAEQSATDLLESPVPFFFEVNAVPRGTKSPDGAYRHGYDASSRLVVVEKQGAATRVEYRLFDYDETPTRYFFLSEFRAKRRVVRVGEIGVDAEVHYDISTSGDLDVTTYLWSCERGRVSSLQVWDLSWAMPNSVVPVYAADGTPRALVRDGKRIWSAESIAGPSDNIDTMAEKMMTVIRRKLVATTERIVVLTVCIEDSNVDALPPQVGVVFARDAEKFVTDPSAYKDGPAALLNPTLQEELGFPTNTQYPFIEITDRDGVHASWSGKEIIDQTKALVDRLNTLRDPGEPPFLLVDMDDDAGRFVPRLSAQDRRALQRYALA